ncbi:MAG TPA: polysaccharide biosynthesis C-terminal domain-containing protein [Polyangiaceae bacterium]|nr:polysaccharide biosynthesis C-terminal domain-containing protein [Polyangiaceae bacterium]
MTTAVSTPSPASQAGVLVLGKILATLSEALVPLIVVRLLGKTDVGVLSGTLLTYTTVTLICTSGLPEAVTFYLSGREAVERKAIAKAAARTMFLAGAAAAIVLALVGLAAHLFTGAGDAGAVSTALGNTWLLALYPLGEVPARMLPNLLVAEGRAQWAARLGVLKALGGSLAALIPLALQAPLWIVLLCISGFGLCYGLSVPILLRLLYRDVPDGDAGVSTLQLIRFGLPLGVTDIVALLNNQLDRYLILLLLPITALAEYQSGAWQIPVLTTIPYTVTAAFAPQMVALFREQRPRDAIALWSSSALKVALVVVPFAMVFMVAAEETMELLFTRAYLDAANVFRCYTSMTIGRIAAFGTVLVAMGRPGLIFRAALLSLLFNFLLSTPLAFALGLIGPALGTALAFIPCIFIYCSYIARGTDLRTSEVFPVRGYFRILALALVASVPAWLFKFSTRLPALPSLLLEAALVLGGFCALGSVLGIISREDWRFAGNWLRMRVR